MNFVNAKNAKLLEIWWLTEQVIKMKNEIIDFQQARSTSMQLRSKKHRLNVVKYS